MWRTRASGLQSEGSRGKRELQRRAYRTEKVAYSLMGDHIPGLGSEAHGELCEPQVLHHDLAVGLRRDGARQAQGSG